MEAEEAVRLINQLSYMPSWAIMAEDWGWSVMVRFTFEAYNSNHDCAVRGYPEKVPVRAQRVHVFDSITSGDALAVYRWVLDTIIDIYAHEAREFLRVKPDLHAPFHPHRPEGEENWTATTPEPGRFFL